MEALTEPAQPQPGLGEGEPLPGAEKTPQALEKRMAANCSKCRAQLRVLIYLTTYRPNLKPKMWVTLFSFEPGKRLQKVMPPVLLSWTETNTTPLK